MMITTITLLLSCHPQCEAVAEAGEWVAVAMATPQITMVTRITMTITMVMTTMTTGVAMMTLTMVTKMSMSLEGGAGGVVEVVPLHPEAVEPHPLAAEVAMSNGGLLQWAVQEVVVEAAGALPSCHQGAEA